MSVSPLPSAAGPQWAVFEAWHGRGAENLSFSPLHCVAFDLQEELLWVGDGDGLAVSLIPQHPIAERIAWHTYSRFRACHSLAAHHVTPVAALVPWSQGVCAAGADQVRLHRRGGFSIASWMFTSPSAGTSSTKPTAYDITTAIVDPFSGGTSDHVFVVSQSSALLRIPFDEPGGRKLPIDVTGQSLASGSRVQVVHAAAPPSGGLVGGHAAIATDLRSGLLGLAFDRSVQLRDPRDLAVVAVDIKGHFAVPVSFLEMVNGKFVVAAGTDRQSPIMMFDLRYPNQAVQSCIVSGAITGLRAANLSAAEGFADGGSTSGADDSSHVGVVAVSHSALHFCTDLSSRVSQSPPGIFGEYQATSVALSATSSAIVVGMDKGAVLALSRPTGRTYGEAAEVDAQFDFVMSFSGKPPPQPMPLTQPKWTSNAGSQMEAGFVFEAARASTTFPPEHYMILAVEPKAPAVHETSDAGRGKPFYNSYRLQRSTMYLAHPKDKISHFIGNPHPYNASVGSEPTKVLDALLAIKKKLKAAGKTKWSEVQSGPYARVEEALQCCYSTQQPVDWQQLNNSKDVIGLDNSLPESWINSVLQCLYHLPGPSGLPLRKVLSRHLCRRRHCVACELGFIYHNMATFSHVKGVKRVPVVQTTNLLRTLRLLPEFVASKVLEPSVSRDDAVAKMHTFTRLVMAAIDKELRSKADALTPAGLAQGSVSVTTGSSTSNNGTAASGIGSTGASVGTASVGSSGAPAPPVTAAPLNFASIFPPSQIAQIPSDYVPQTFGTEFTVRGAKQQASGGGAAPAPPPASVIPPRLFWEVPASATKVEEGLQHLLKQIESHNGETVSIRRLPPIIVLLLNPEHGSLKPPVNLRFSRSNELYIYTLQSNVIHMAADLDDSGHFVAHLKLSHNPAHSGDAWVVANDYVVSVPQKSEELLEAMIPSHEHRATVVTFYCQETLQKVSLQGYNAAAGQAVVTAPAPNSMVPALPSSVAAGAPIMATPHHHAVSQQYLYELLGQTLIEDKAAKELVVQANPERPYRIPTSIPQPITSLSDIAHNDLVAIDAEYVVLQWGNLRPDEPEWMRRQRKPMMSLARVSCVLSKEPGHERVVLDDYVHTPEPVLDYVTQYSGISPGDLDVTTSAFHVTTLKSLYLKLRALADRNVIFVGHGLSQDFRVMNLNIVNGRFVDTLELFQKNSSRKLSLRFLAYHVLRERVQETSHDSIEDARTSLRLFRAYQDLRSTKKFDSFMDHLLQVGQDTGWYVPEVGSAALESGSAIGAAVSFAARSTPPPGKSPVAAVNPMLKAPVSPDLAAAALPPSASPTSAKGSTPNGSTPSFGTGSPTLQAAAAAGPSPSLNPSLTLAQRLAGWTATTQLPDLNSSPALPPS